MHFLQCISRHNRQDVKSYFIIYAEPQSIVLLVAPHGFVHTYFIFNMHIGSRPKHFFQRPSTFFNPLFMLMASQIFSRQTGYLFSQSTVFYLLLYTTVICSCFKKQLQCTIAPFSHGHQCLTLIGPERFILQLLTISMGFLSQQLIA